MFDQDVDNCDPRNKAQEDAENIENDIGRNGERRNTGDGSPTVISDDAMADETETKKSKRMKEGEEPNESNKRYRTEIRGSTDEADTAGQDLTELGEQAFDKTRVGAESSPLRANLKFQCTACSELTENVYAHPLLKVIICKSCKYLLAEKMHVKVGM